MELTGIRYLDDRGADEAFTERVVFCRVDFNVPLKQRPEGGAEITDDARIRAALPTIRTLRERGAKVVLASHLGRPKGVDPAFTLEPCAARLAELLDDEVRFADDCVGDGVAKVIRDAPSAGVVLLENLRYHAAEKAGDEHFAKALAEPCQIYVNDAFGTCHRADASMYGVPKNLPERYAGLLVQSELRFLSQLIGSPPKPFVAVLGGAKVSDKIGVIKSLLGRCRTLLVGGAMAYTFLAAQKKDVGDSLVERDRIGLARELLDLGVSRRTQIILPQDHIVARSIDEASGEATEGPEISDGFAGFDIGPKTVAQFSEVIAKAGTVFWNGPLGVFEKAPFRNGTMAVAQALADSNAVSVVGGGDSAAAIQMAGLTDAISHLSTGGGASLQFIEGTPLPGVEALRAGHQFA